MKTVDEAIAIVTNTPPWLSREERGQRRYNWSPAEDTVLRECYGRMPRPEIAKRVSAALQRVTGDLNATRSADAIANRAFQLGLERYTGEPGEMYLAYAARLAGIPYSIVHDAARSGALPTVRRGKQRYVTAGDWEVWLALYRNRQETEARALASITEETISKKEAMALTGLSETHITRYLQTGIIRSWKIPQGTQGRGYWRVSQNSVEAFIQARAGGRLQELLDGNPAYVALRNGLTTQIRSLRRAGRLAQRDPLIIPKSKYHPGCFTVAQVASHAGLSAQVLYEAIKVGHLEARVVKRGGRPRYAIEPAEARRYAAYVRERDAKRATVRWRDPRRREIAQEGLLTTADLARRWRVPASTVLRHIHQGLRGHKLPSRMWGRYRVFEPADVETFEREVLQPARTESAEAQRIHAAGLLTTSDVAQRLGVSKVTVTAWVRKGKLPSQQMGRSLAFKPVDVEVFERNKP